VDCWGGRNAGGRTKRLEGRSQRGAKGMWSRGRRKMVSGGGSARRGIYTGALFVP
jgi:hypothetical protein